MKTLLLLLMSILMPNFGIALIIKGTIHDAEHENKILTRKEIEGLYFLSTLILLIPILMSILSIFLNYNQLASWRNLSIVGIFISAIHLYTTKDLKK